MINGWIFGTNVQLVKNPDPTKSSYYLCLQTIAQNHSLMNMVLGMVTVEIILHSLSIEK